MLHLVKFALVGLLLSGCAVKQPPTSIQQPMTAKPVANNVAAPADGAIFHAGNNERPLFEDKRARNVGDLLVINIVETTTGSRKSSSSSSTANSVNAATPTISRGAGALAKLLLTPFTATSTTSNKTAGAEAGAANETLTGTISVTVVEVLANGNLVVSGEKQVALNTSDEFIRFSGVVNPTTISNLNVVPSNQVADAHIEYKNAGAMNEIINDTQSLGFLGRFFLSVLPF